MVADKIRSPAEKISEQKSKSLQLVKQIKLRTGLLMDSTNDGFSSSCRLDSTGYSLS